MSHYKKSAAADRDSLFGSAAAGDKKKKKSTKKPSKLLTGSSTGAVTAVTEAPPAGARSSKSKDTNLGYQQSKESQQSSTLRSPPKLSPQARAAKLKEAEDYKEKANKCLQKSFFSSPDPVAASTLFKRAADCYQAIGSEFYKEERLYRLESAECNRNCRAWASAAADYTRAAELVLLETSSSGDEQRREACLYHKKAAGAWQEMGEKAKAAASQVQAALVLNLGDDGVESSRLLGKEALVGIEEAIEAHVPDVFNPFARYRQIGTSAFIDPNDDDENGETVSNPSPETLSMAESHIVTKSYAHEPLQDLVHMLVNYGEFTTALYAAGAATCLLERDGISTLSLSRSFVTETILLLSMGDPIAAEQEFLNRHVQKNAYLASRECKLAEDLFRAIKMRDPDALEEARSITGSNRAALANLDESLRSLVPMLRLSGVARKTVGDTVSGGQQAKKQNLPSLEELGKMKTGYEQEMAEGAGMDGDALASELDGLDFGLDDDGEKDPFGDDGSLEDDDDIDLR